MGIISRNLTTGMASGLPIIIKMPVTGNWQWFLLLINNCSCGRNRYQNHDFQTSFSNVSNSKKEYKCMSNNIHESGAVVNNLAKKWLTYLFIEIERAVLQTSPFSF